MYIKAWHTLDRPADLLAWGRPRKTLEFLILISIGRVPHRMTTKNKDFYDLDCYRTVMSGELARGRHCYTLHISFRAKG